MKILQIIPSYKPAYIYGGPVNSVSKLCEDLATDPSVDILMITTNANGPGVLDVPLGETVRVDGLRVIYFRRNTGDPHEASLDLWRYLNRHAAEYDLVHIHSWWNLLAIVATGICVRKRVKVILSPRGMLSRYVMENSNSLLKRTLHATVGKRLLRKTYYHATSEQEDEECAQVIPGWQGFCIPNIIELPDIPIHRPDHAVFTLGFLSRIDPKKGLEYVIQALARLDFPVRLVIAGSGEEAYLAQLKALAAEAGVTDRIVWRGWLGPQEKFRELMDFDLLMLTSHNENFANVVIESLYMGTPVCISDQVGLSGFVSRSGMGWVTRLDVDAVRDSIVEARNDSAKRSLIHATGRKVIDEQYAERILIRRYMDMYDAVRAR